MHARKDIDAAFCSWVGDDCWLLVWRWYEDDDKLHATEENIYEFNVVECYAMRYERWVVPKRTAALCARVATKIVQNFFLITVRPRGPRWYINRVAANMSSRYDITFGRDEERIHGHGEKLKNKMSGWNGTNGKWANGVSGLSRLPSRVK